MRERRLVDVMFCWFLPVLSDGPRYPCFTRCPFPTANEERGRRCNLCLCRLVVMVSVIMEGANGRVGFSVSVSTALRVVGNTSFIPLVYYFIKRPTALKRAAHVSPWVSVSRAGPW
ncbi:hypothetical protein F4782DRAFT_308532 [Xylaria castorea]|nr:hypothetical protein F4782DRAFT_308532 [Xylaria castorea]